MTDEHKPVPDKGTEAGAKNDDGDDTPIAGQPDKKVPHRIASKKPNPRHISARRLKKLRAKERQHPKLGPGEIQPERRQEKDWRPAPIFSPRYGAIDLGTNNCRLLVATPSKGGFRVVDAYSQIVRLGEGLGASGRLSDAAMDRTIDALKMCADKVKHRRVTSLRCIATQACRLASNGEEFLDRVKRETGIEFELITTEEEAGLSVRGCLDLTDPKSDAVLVFDIGGGSTEISWVRKIAPAENGQPPKHKIVAWLSIPMGVVTVAEKYGGHNMTRERYDEVVQVVGGAIRAYNGADELRPLFENGQAHLLGTSGTVTSIAGVHLGLKKYIRREIDGIWLASSRAIDLSERLRAMSYEARQREPCIGPDRADLVVPGCAIMEGILGVWPATRIRVADRGLREGVLAGLIAMDRRKRRRRKRRK